MVSLAKFIVNSWQGALSALKITGNAEPLLIFERFVFDKLLRPGTPITQEIEAAQKRLLSWELTGTAP